MSDNKSYPKVEVLGIDKAEAIRSHVKETLAKKEEHIKKWKAEKERYKYDVKETLYVLVTRTLTKSGPRYEGEVIAGLPYPIDRLPKFHAPSLDALQTEARFNLRNALLAWRVIGDEIRANEWVANKVEVAFAEVRDG